MNETRPVGASVQRVLGELTHLQHLPQPPAAIGIRADLTAQRLQEIIAWAESLSRACDIDICAGNGALIFPDHQ